MVLVLGSLFSAAGPEASAPPRIPHIAFEKYRLPNGLEVILHEDHSTPIVGVNLWYHVGSKNEHPGRTGFAHLFEHMMFQGSKHYDRDYFGPLQEAGGRLNGSTNQDRTNYWETVPSNYLELALWMESDRMGFLLPAMTQEKFENQRDVVKNERRQSYENRPYGLAYETLLAALFPPDHPYSWPTIGSMADLDAATREDVARFFRQYYHPGNASLCIAGDFDPAEAKRLVAKYFGPIPAGPPVHKVAPRPATLAGDRRIRMTDRVGLARLYLVWPTVAMFTEDEPALEILADVLSGGKTARLDKSLVRTKQIAQHVQAFQNSQEIAGAMMIVATARPGHTVAELESAIVEEIQRLQQEPPSPEEVERAVNRFEAQLVRSLESVSDFGGRADRLNMYNVFAGDPGYLEKDFPRYLKVTPAAVQRAAQKYLAGPRVVLEVVPGKETSIIPDPRAEAAKVRQELARSVSEPPLPREPVLAEDPARTSLPKPGPTPRFALPPIHRGKLANGLEVLVVENHELPTVNLNLVFRVGRSYDPPDKLGLAGLLAAVWDEGTTHRTAEQIADELGGIGATLSIATDWDATAARLFTLKRHLAKALDVYADVLQNPTFPEAELARERNIALGRLLQVRDEPDALALLAVGASLYGQDHPYGYPQYGTPATLKAITRQDLAEFYRTRVVPEQASLIAVGDVTLAELLPVLDKALGQWRSESPPAPDPVLPRPPMAKGPRLILVDKPGAAQSVIAATLIGTERNSPDYHAVVVMNSIFGGQFSSRLNMNLRESKGYTYGARSWFDWRIRQPGPFQAVASVQTAVTAPAVVEFLKEFQGMIGAKPLTPEELEFSKAYLTRGYPAGFETPAQLASHLEVLVEHRLPDDYFNTFIPKIAAVDGADVLRVARQRLALDQLTIIVVGDRSKIEKDLRNLPEGKNLVVCRFDENFRMVPEGTGG